MPNKVSSGLILRSATVEQSGVTSERRPLLSVPLSAGDAERTAIIGQVEVERRPLSAALCWRRSSHLRPGSPGGPGQPPSHSLRRNIYFIYFSAVAAC